MMKRLTDRLRGARRIELFAALALAALLALMLIDLGGSDGGEPRTELESRVERILGRVEGAGRVSAMVTQDGDGAVTGVLIVAEGLADVQTYLRVQRAVSALLNVEVAKIEIIGGGFSEAKYEQDG